MSLTPLTVIRTEEADKQNSINKKLVQRLLDEMNETSPRQGP